jgi:hypothetical protein
MNAGSIVGIKVKLARDIDSEKPATTTSRSSIRARRSMSASFGVPPVEATADGAELKLAT